MGRRWGIGSPKYNEYNISNLAVAYTIPIINATGQPNCALRDGNLLYSVEPNYNRVVAYDLTSKQAVALYGQTNYGVGTANQGQLNSPTASTLWYPSFVAVECSSHKVWVADSNNNRILRYSAGNPVAEVVIGQQSFVTQQTPTYNQQGLPGEEWLLNPHGIIFNSVCSYMWVADSSNNRISRFKAPFYSGMKPDAILGGLSMQGGCGPTLFNDPRDVAVDEEHSTLWIADGQENNRVIGCVTDMFPPGSSTSTASISSTQTPSTSPTHSKTPIVTPSTSLTSTATPTNTPTQSLPPIRIPSNTISPTSSPTISPAPNSLTPAPSSSAVDLEELKCDTITTGTCYIGHDIHITTTLMFGSNSNSSVFINGSLFFSNNSHTFMSVGQMIEVTQTAHFGGELTVVLANGQLSDGSVINVTIVTYARKVEGFNSITIQQQEEGTSSGLRIGCQVNPQTSYGEKSLSLLISVSNCADQSEGGGVNSKLIIGLVVGVGGCAILLVIVGVIIGAAAVGYFRWKRNSRNVAAKV